MLVRKANRWDPDQKLIRVCPVCLGFFDRQLLLEILEHMHLPKFGAQWLSGRDRRAAGSSLTSVTALWSLCKSHLSYLSTGSTQEDTSLFN